MQIKVTLKIRSSSKYVGGVTVTKWVVDKMPPVDREGVYVEQLKVIRTSIINNKVSNMDV